VLTQPVPTLADRQLRKLPLAMPEVTVSVRILARWMVC